MMPLLGRAKYLNWQLGRAHTALNTERQNENCCLLVCISMYHPGITEHCKMVGCQTVQLSILSRTWPRTGKCQNTSENGTKKNPSGRERFSLRQQVANKKPEL